MAFAVSKYDNFIQLDPPIDEIEEARILGADCGKIPKCYITGFRAPYLQSASWTYDALVAMNITYFSSDADGYADVGDQTRIGNKVPVIDT